MPRFVSVHLVLPSLHLCSPVDLLRLCLSSVLTSPIMDFLRLCSIAINFGRDITARVPYWYR